MRDVLFPAGYVEVKTPLIFNKALWETLGPLGSTTAQNMFLIESRRRADGHEGDELPGPLCCVFAQRGAQLPRPADALSRADAAAPQRGVGRAVRPDPRAAVLAGRRALLRDAGADRRRGRAAAAAGAARLRRLRPAVSRRSCRRGPTSSSARSRPGITPRRSSRRRSSAPGMAYTLNERRRRVLRAEDRLRRHRRDRPEVAVRDDPARLPACRSGST